MRLFVRLIFAFVVAPIAAGSGALADTASDCANLMNTPDATIAACSEVIRNHAKTSWAYVNRGNAYEKKGDRDKAIADYTKAIEIETKAIEINPEQAYFYVERGAAYEAMGDHDRAVADYRSALALPRQGWDARDAARAAARAALERLGAAP